MTRIGDDWGMNHAIDWILLWDVNDILQCLAICGWSLQLAFLLCLLHWSLFNRRWLSLFLALVLLPLNVLVILQSRFVNFTFDSFFPIDHPHIALQITGLAMLVSFSSLFLARLSSFPVLFFRMVTSPVFQKLKNSRGRSCPGPASHRFPLLFLSVFIGGWMLLSGTGAVLAQDAGGTAPSAPPPAGAPSTGTPSGGTSSSPRTGRRTSRRTKRPKADKMQIKALSMVGFLSSSVSYMRDHLGPAIIMQLRKLQPAFLALGYGLLVIISLFTLLRLGSESDDASALPAFILRMIVCGVLIGLSSFIVQTLFQVGFAWTSSGSVNDMVGAASLAAPGGGFSFPDTSGGAGTPALPSGDTDVHITSYEFRYLNAIDEWRRNSKERFITGLEKFRNSTLKVRITQSRFFDPKEAGLEYFIPDFSKAGKDGFVHQFLVGLNPKNWSPLQLYSALEASILVMQIGIFTGWILLVFVMPFAELLAPVFFSVAVDKGKLFDQMTMPFIRGLITASLIMPLVNIILEGIAYNVASLGFSVFDIRDGKKGTEVFQWDPATEQVVATADPTVLVFTACFFILISGLSLILSPIIAYRIMSGELFGAAVGAISGWTAGLVSLGISAVSQGVGASFQRQAEHLSNVGNYQSSAASAAGAAKAAHIRNEAEYHSTLTQIRQGSAQTLVNSALTNGMPSGLDRMATNLTGFKNNMLNSSFTSVKANVENKALNETPAERQRRIQENASRTYSPAEQAQIMQYNPHIVFHNDKPYAKFQLEAFASESPRFASNPVLSKHRPHPLPPQPYYDFYVSPPPTPTSPVVVHYQQFKSLDGKTTSEAYFQLGAAGLMPQNPEHAQIFNLPPVDTPLVVDNYRWGQSRVLDLNTPEGLNQQMTAALRQARTNPSQNTFVIGDTTLTRDQLNQFEKYYAMGLRIDKAALRSLAEGKTVDSVIHDGQLSSDVRQIATGVTLVGGPYHAGVSSNLAANVAENQLAAAKEIKRLQDEAVDADYAGQMAAASIAFRFAERAAAMRAKGQFIQSILSTAQTVLARQIENNRV